MRHAFLGEVILAAFSVVPRGWAVCDGALLNITDYPELFQLLGITYGGNGTTTFALPDLRGRVPVDTDNGTFPVGASGGTAAHTLTTAEMPAHNHIVNTNNVGGAFATPSGNFLAAVSDPTIAIYRPTSDGSTLHTSTIGDTGGGQAHENMPPYLVMNYFICIDGGCGGCACYPIQ